MRYIEVKSCCWCGFNEHGQYWPEYQPKDSYLGVYIKPPEKYPGPPMLYCMYDDSENFRENMRSVTHWHGLNKRIIWIAGDPKYEGEFEKQLSGFPDWCPCKKLEELR